MKPEKDGFQISMKCNVETIIQFQHGSLRYKHRTDVVQLLPREPWFVFFFFHRSGGPVSANKKIHERGNCLGGRLHEFFPVLWIRTQFRTDGSPDGVQPSLQNSFANGRCGLNKPRQWKIWQSGTGPPACDTMIELLAEDSQMDVDDGFRALLEKFIEHTFDNVPWIN